MARLVAGSGVIHRHHDRRGTQRAEVSDCPIRIRVRQNRHPVTGLDPELNQAARDPAHRASEVLVGNLEPALYRLVPERGTVAALGRRQHPGAECLLTRRAFGGRTVPAHHPRYSRHSTAITETTTHRGMILSWSDLVIVGKGARLTMRSSSYETGHAEIASALIDVRDARRP